VLVELFEYFVKLLGPLENVSVIRVNVICVLSVTVKRRLSLCTTDRDHGFCCQAALPFNQIHLLLELLLVVEGDLVGVKLLPAVTPEFSLLVHFFGLLVRLSATVSRWKRRQHAETRQHSVSALSWSSTDGEPVVNTVGVHRDMALNGLALL